ncbi:MAG TPA: phosphate signaling complex protein PhoU [Flavobacteriaceae bacterium]|nr:phosphate signaling complex protein PhoU [Flavobacteriaceae bacterium]
MEQANYQKDILTQALQDMLQLSINQFEKAMEAFLNNDADLAEEVIYKETRVNALDLKIEKDCERFLAMHQPVAGDLRYIMAVLKINYELERIADHAFGISKYVVEDELYLSEDLLTKLEFNGLVETINTMIDFIYDAYENENIKAARKVFKKDKILDKINTNAFKILEEEINKDVAITNQALKLLSVIKKCERVGDLLKNIAEEIIFYQEAEVVKHRKKKK